MRRQSRCLPYISLCLLLAVTTSTGCLSSARAVPEDMSQVEAKHLCGQWNITEMRDGQAIPDFARVYLSFKPSGKFKRGPIESSSKDSAPSANLLGVPPCGTFVVQDGQLIFTSDQINDGKPWSTSFTMTDDTLTLERDPFLRWGKNGECCRSVYTYKAAK